MKQLKLFLITALVCIAAVSCKKQTEYFIDGGGTHNPQVNMSTYDYLKQNALFDTLILMIDRAGIKDAVNASNSTLFACTDYAVVNWLTATRGRILNTYGQDSAMKFNLNSFSNTQLKDTLSQYIVSQRVERAGLKLTDTEYTTLLAGDRKVVYLLESTEYTSDVSTRPRYIFFTKVIGTRDQPGVTVPVAERDIAVRCQTTGILTTNGVVHVLENTHLYGFGK